VTHTLEVEMTPVAPYDLRRSLGAPDATRRAAGGVLSLAYPTPAGPATATVWQRHDGTLCARILASHEPSAHDRLAEMLGVRLDTRPFLAMAASDSLLAPLSMRHRGQRRLMLSTPVHALIRAVSGQLIRSSEAARIERRILRELGSPHGEFRLAPDAPTLAAAHPAILEGAGLSPRRAVVLSRAARRLKLDALAGEPSQTARLRVLREPGLGRWSAGVLMMDGFGRQELGLSGDLGLVRLAEALGVDEPSMLDRYGEWQGMASLWLLGHPLAARHAVARRGAQATRSSSERCISSAARATRASAE
jgi:3-methyladenine DNA glycosylase/8-oxoguanine DNA glycosylase